MNTATEWAIMETKQRTLDSKNETPSGFLSWLRCENKTRLHSKNETLVLAKAIPDLGIKLKRGFYVFWLFFQIGMCSPISFKRSRRELSIDMAEYRSILKNKGVLRMLVILQDRPIISHIILKVSARCFYWYDYVRYIMKNYLNSYKPPLFRLFCVVSYPFELTPGTGMGEHPK